MQRLRHFQVGALLVASLLLSAAVSAAPLQDFDGKSRTIADYTGHGKWLVVMIWASDCHVCNVEAHHYVDFHSAHHASDARVLGISMDGDSGKADAREFIKRHALNFVNLLGEPDDVAAMYSQLTGRPWVGTPTFLIYDPAGKLTAQQVGAVPVTMIEDFIKNHERSSRSGATNRSSSTATQRAPANGS